jgi:hypothetical protein
MNPRAKAAEITGCPGNADLLGRDLIPQFELDRKSDDAHLFDPRPAELVPVANPPVSENLGALKLAHVEGTNCQLFNGHALLSLAQ